MCHFVAVVTNTGLFVEITLLAKELRLSRPHLVAMCIISEISAANGRGTCNKQFSAMIIFNPPNKFSTLNGTISTSSGINF